MTKIKTTLVVATMAIAMAGCAKKRPEVLPPAPVSQATGVDPNAGATTNPDGAIVPGSDADFKRSVTSNTIHFGTDQYDIDPEARAILDSQAAWLVPIPMCGSPSKAIATSAAPANTTSRWASAVRNSAKNYLAARGVSPERMNVISYGKERPIALGSDEAAWAQNRRDVTVVLN